MAEQTAVALLARFAEECAGGLPDEVVSDVARRTLDVLGNALAAEAESGAPTDPEQAVVRVVDGWGTGGSSRVIGRDGRYPAHAAALANGTFAHALDFDDTHLPSVLHPSASIVPAGLAVAEQTGAGGPQFLAAVAAGVEICNRLGMSSYDRSIRNSIFFEKGLHATSICGTIGGAVTAGILHGLDADGLASAMGIAASMGAGLIEANRTGGTVKRVHCGWAAHAGVVAAEMARAGVTGPPTVLEGRFGFFTAYLDGRADLSLLLDDLGTRWEVLRTSYKPYPSNHFTHPGIDCALALVEAGLDPADVAEIELGVADPTIRTIGEPHDEKVAPRSSYHAKFSGPYTIATAMLGGGGLGVYLDDFGADAFKDPARRGLAAKVTCVPDQEASEAFPNSFAAVLRVRTKQGSRLEHRVGASRGSAESPLTADELALKFDLNAGRGGREERVPALRERVQHLVRPGAVVDGLLANTVT